MTGVGSVWGIMMERWDQTGIVSGAGWRADGMGSERTLVFTTSEMGRQRRLLRRARLVYVARNNPCNFFLLKHPEAAKRDPPSAIDVVFTTV